MVIKDVATLDLAERRELELMRVAGQDLALDKMLDDLLLGLSDDDGSVVAAREALDVAASSAKVVGSAAPVVTHLQPDPAKLLVDDYYFPDVSLTKAEFMSLSSADQTRALKTLLSTGKTYHQIRDEYCAISLSMSELGEAPPKFRPMRPLPRRTAMATPDDTLMMRDRQVIDMHWLHSREKRDELPDRTFARLFVQDAFDFDMAAELAGKAWTNEIKADKILNLIPYEQYQLACLRTKAVADAWHNAERSMKTTIDRRLREQLVSEPSLRHHIEDLKLLWLADKVMDGEGLSAIAQMHSWLSGKAPLSISTLSSKLKRMRRRTAARGSRA